eukprot:352130-Chlamydomonas_euryale.AAC.3
MDQVATIQVKDLGSHAHRICEPCARTLLCMVWFKGLGIEVENSASHADGHYLAQYGCEG